MDANQQNAHAHSGGYQRKRKKKMRQLRPFWNTYRSPGTEANKRCTPQQDDIIHDKKNKTTTRSVTPRVVTQVEMFEDPERTSSLTRSHGAAELQYKSVHPRPWDVWLEQITTPNCHQERGMETIMDHNSTPPRETPATERPASVAKWKAQRTVRNNQVVESPRRLQCGVMLFRPWDIWILQALQLQKAVRRFNERRHSRSWSRSGVVAQS